MAPGGCGLHPQIPAQTPPLNENSWLRHWFLIIIVKILYVMDESEKRIRVG